MKIFKILLLIMCMTLSVNAQDWAGMAVPANLPSGMVWELNPVSDSFNYESTGSNRPEAFTSRWNDLYINNFSGPSNTSFHKDHSWTTGGYLNIHAAQDSQYSIIYTGCISSKAQMTYPMYMEARVKQANCMLANNIWMISGDETEELDMLESYPNSQTGREWLDQRIHLSHHVFIRNPFTDYQPRDEEEVFGTWYYEEDKASWRGEWFDIGVYWVNPHHVEYYINGIKVRTIKKNTHSFLDPEGNLSEHTTDFDAIDKYGYTGGTGLSKPQHIIINMEQQSWLSNLNIYPTSDELDDVNGKNLFLIDWIRVYDAVPVGGKVPVTSVSIQPRTVTIRPGETFQLNALISPADATKKIVTWSSANTDFVTVNGQGLVKGIKAENIVVTVETFDGGFTDNIIVSVAGDPIDGEPDTIDVTGVSVLPASATLEVGETAQLTGSVIPFNATVQAVTWSSSDINVATVNTTGLVTAVGEGTAIITGTTLSGGKTDTSTITVTDGGSNPSPVSVTGVSVSPTAGTLNVGQTLNLNETVLPSNATNKAVTWSSNNIGVATVNADGLVTAVALGSATITVTTQDGSFPASAFITVNNNIPPPDDEIVIEAESFNNTSGTFNDAGFGGPGLGANATANTINFVNSGDWVEYTINVGTAGNYNIEYNISTPSNNAQIQLSIGETVASTTNVPNNGAWDTYGALNGGSVALPSGSVTIRLTASGSNTWQWNLDKITLTRVGGSSNMSASRAVGSQSKKSRESRTNSDPIEGSIPKMVLYPNPAKDQVNVLFKNEVINADLKILDMQGKLVFSKIFSGHISKVSTRDFNRGIYIIKLKIANRTLIDKLVLK
ncbi:Ig-like domain-containing protein [Flavivirga algicola]|uniref:Carbohydrate-binding protein n=1 Tax=Flavivirga algicola TaxID=2729136 RepID=A0ABX1S2L8_9FLAO|nr:Ig-like domain-containing protein [Flavivirga algicola]NMH89495.1 carbohydrate-binding protein [Flavivirga algicola]